MPPVNGYVIKEITKHAMNAINSSNIADSEIPPLSGPDAFKALFVGRTTGGWNQRQDMEFHEASIDAVIAAGIFTVPNIQAANTLNDIRDILIAANSDLTRTFQSGNRAWQ